MFGFGRASLNHLQKPCRFTTLRSESLLVLLLPRGEQKPSAASAVHANLPGALGFRV